jgi:predicted ester cyclase
MKGIRKFSLLGALLVIGLVATMSFSLLQAQEDTTAESYREVLYRIVDEGVTPGDFDLLDELIAEDYVVQSPLGDLDREGLKGFLGALRASLSDFQMVRDQVIVEGEFAATRTTITGVFEKEFPLPTGVVPPNGQPIEVQIINVFRFDEDGRVVEEWAQFDNLGFLIQLGAMPAP